MRRLFARWARVTVAVAMLATPAAPRSMGEATNTPHPRPPSEVGVASWYGEECSKNATASGESFDFNALTAAHRHLPLGTRILVTNLKNGKMVNLRVNDRGPGVQGRILDVSMEAAKRLGFKGAGLATIRIEVIHSPRGNSTLQPSRKTRPPAADGSHSLERWPGYEVVESGQQPTPVPSRPN
ncbi:MAG: septal ring lytic transglycosylase RlpA family protein [Acidobacteriia bacterium]|nr:septal ring lytic transglycosylase RlpA family protein [Terriglobia bacterium]